MSFWKGKRVVVTGGTGFLGSHIVALAEKQGAEVFVPRSKDFDLTNSADAFRYIEEVNPRILIHSAAHYGGIRFNQLYPGKIYHTNLVMGANIMEAARRCKVDKFVGIGTACSYPGYLEGELKEENLWDGPPHETVINYGLTKKMMAIQGWAYKKQFGFNSIHLILTNLYGRKDTFHIDRAHVVSALIKKFVEAEQKSASEVEVWGTGKPIREFLYVEDCAEAVLRATERYDDTLPLNIGCGESTTIRELATHIQKISGFQGRLAWNSSKPDGQMKKILEVSRMKRVLDWTPPTDLQTGLEKTISWYRDNKEQADLRL